MSDMIDTTEMYLRTIFELEEEGIVPMRARIAERLGHSGPTVSQTVARMERDGLVRVTDDRHLELSATGRLAATRVMRKHRLAERLLVDILGLEWEYVHEEACRWEHVMSDRVERRILALIGDHRDSPWGNPIPGLEELEGEREAPDADHSRSLRDWAGRAPVSGSGRGAGSAESGAKQTVVVRRIGEIAQVEPETLAVLIEAGVLPGTTVRVWVEGADVCVGVGEDADTAAVRLPREVAAHVFGERFQAP